MGEYVDKKISFYKLVLEKKGKQVDPIDIFSHIKSLNLETEDRCFRVKDGKYNLMTFHDEENDLFIPLKFILGSGKTKDLPCLEEKGKTEPLDIENKSLFEPTHMMLFNNNILGAESNYQGPTPMGLKSYFLRLAREHVDYVDVIQLVKPDLLETLYKIGDIKLFDLSVHRNFGNLFEEASPSTYHALKSLENIGDSQEIGVHLKSSKHIRGLNWRKIFNVFQKEDISSINKAKIRAMNNDTNKMEYFNLLDQHIIANKQVVKNDDRYKRVDSKAMFTAIKSSFKEHQSEIEGIILKKNRKQKTLNKWTG